MIPFVPLYTSIYSLDKQRYPSIWIRYNQKLIIMKLLVYCQSCTVGREVSNVPQSNNPNKLTAWGN